MIWGLGNGQDLGPVTWARPSTILASTAGRESTRDSHSSFRSDPHEGARAHRTRDGARRAVLPAPLARRRDARPRSGLRYTYANLVAWLHYLLLWVAMLSGFCCAPGFGSFFTQSSGIVPVLMVSGARDDRSRVSGSMACSRFSSPCRRGMPSETAPSDLWVPDHPGPS